LETSECARLSPRRQRIPCTATGIETCRDCNDHWAIENALVQAEAGPLFTPGAASGLTEDERRRAAQVDRIALLSRTGIRDDQVVAVRKVSRHRAGVLADPFAAVRRDVRWMKVAPRGAAIRVA
jgi:hypothetical protein